MVEETDVQKNGKSDFYAQYMKLFDIVIRIQL